MTNKFRKFISKINYTPQGPFNEADIYSAALVSQEVFSIGIQLPAPPSAMEMKKFIDTLNNNFGFKVKLEFKYLSQDFSSKTIFEFIQYIAESFLQKQYLARQLSEEQFTVKQNKVIMNFVTKKGCQRFKESESEIIRALNMLGFVGLEFEINVVEDLSISLSEVKKQHINALASQTSLFKESSQQIEKKSLIQIRQKTNNVISIIQAKEEFQNEFVTIEGLIFERKEKQTKSGWIIIEFSITDYNDAIYISVFAGKTDAEKAKYDKYQVGKWVQVKGKLELNTYRQNQPEVKASKMSLIQHKIETKKDESPLKRVELNTRTRMSTMDGIVSAKELVDRAIHFGHTAIAITDSESVQSFPSFFNASNGIKAIYGSSFNIIDRRGNIVYNTTQGSLGEQTYVIFDLETTGLSPIYHEIIEFGAIKLKGGKIIDRKQFFIKPKSKISNFTTELTGITEEMVKNSINEEEGVKEMLDYFADSVLVAHNAPFDMGFIHEKATQYKMPQIQHTYIDTLMAAKFLEPKAKRFNLEKVSQRMGHSYDPTIAHRADYDAEVLANVWISMISMLRRVGITTLEQLSNAFDEVFYQSYFTKEISMLAKNNDGLKELFKLISLTSTKQFYKSPKLFWDQLPTSGNILIGSGGLKSHLVDLMLTGTRKQIKENISKYDYIEIQPLRNYSHLIARGKILRRELIDVIKFIINEAKAQNKIVVATGDVRYLDEKDKIYHSVYINAKGLGGSRHHLFQYNEKHPEYPIQSFLTTKEMLEQFQFLGDDQLAHEIVVTNTNKVADMIEECVVIKDKLYTPKIDNSDKKLSDLVWETAKSKYGDKLPKIIFERVTKELSNIIKHGFGVIYYIAHKLVKKSLDDGYLVGSRGSVGSSVVATFSGITEVNPLPPHYICKLCSRSEFFVNGEYKCGYDLPDKKCIECLVPLDKEGHDIPFETFLGFDANKVPDIDLNFSGDYQATIHKEVEKEFGKTHAFRAGTISTVAEKTAFGYVMAWAEETGKSVSRVFSEFLAKKVAGTKRTSGQHPGGIIVIPKEFDVEDFSPINYPANDTTAKWLTTHFDFHAIHDNVLKLDLLGHDDPTAIRMLQRITGIKPSEIPYVDEKVLSLFSSTQALGVEPKDISGETTGVMGIPEFGTQFVRRMLKSVEVKTFSDLISISGLSHGTDVWTGNGEALVKKQGKHLNELISCRDDIMTDLINKGIKPLESFVIMEQVRKGQSITSEQEKMMRVHNVEEWYIESCKAIKYMFPKAHATAYVQMAWKIAWFKVYHPLAYYATYFTTRADVADIETFKNGKEAINEKLIDFKARKHKRGEEALSNKEVALIPVLEIGEELYARGFSIQNISIEKSLADEWIISEDGKSLIPPFSTIDGLGSSVTETIIASRNEKPFTSIEDLKNRTSLNKTSLDKMEKLNVFDNMEKTNQLTLF